MGSATTQIQAGLCQRGHRTVGPLHQATRADAVERLRAAERETVLNATVTRLVARGFVTRSRGHVALDARDLATTKRSLGAGRQATTAWIVTKKKEVQQVTRLSYGFTVLIVDEVRLRLVVAATVVPINEHESQHTLALVRQAVENLGAGVLRVLLLDRGFLDGETRWTLTHDRQIDLVVPAQDGMQVTTDARRIRRRSSATTGRERRTPVPMARCAGRARSAWWGWSGWSVTTRMARPSTPSRPTGRPSWPTPSTWWSSRAGPGPTPQSGRTPVFVTSLPVTVPLAVLDRFDLRSLIEHTACRALKQGWCVESYPQKTLAAVRGPVLLTLLTFTLANAFRTAPGQRLAQQGIRRQRAEAECGHVVVFAGEHCGRFDIEAVLLLLGVDPATWLRVDPAEIRRRYGLPPADALPRAA